MCNGTCNALWRYAFANERTLAGTSRSHMSCYSAAQELRIFCASHYHGERPKLIRSRPARSQTQSLVPLPSAGAALPGAHQHQLVWVSQRSNRCCTLQGARHYLDTTTTTALVARAPLSQPPRRALALISRRASAQMTAGCVMYQMLASFVTSHRVVSQIRRTSPRSSRRHQWRSSARKT